MPIFRLKLGKVMFMSYSLLSTCGSQVKRHVHKVVSEVFSWSLTQAAVGKGPQTGFYQEAFAANTWRYSMRGRVLAGGIRLVSKKCIFLLSWDIHQQVGEELQLHFKHGPFNRQLSMR